MKTFFVSFATAFFVLLCVSYSLTDEMKFPPPSYLMFAALVGALARLVELIVEGLAAMCSAAWHLLRLKRRSPNESLF